MQLFNRSAKASISTQSSPDSQKRKTRRCCSVAQECSRTCEASLSTSPEQCMQCMRRKKHIKRWILISALTLLLISFCPIPLSSEESLNVWQLVVEMLLSLVA